MRKTLAFALLGTTLLLSCARDRNLEDYQREKIREDLGLIQAAAGIYRGVLYSNTDQSPLGAVELSLQASTRAEKGSNGSKAESSPVLLGNLRVHGNRLMSIRINDASYDSVTGFYQANVPVKQQNGESIEVVIRGTITEGRFEGNIEAYNFHESGGTIRLERDAPLPEIASGGQTKDGSQPSQPMDEDNTALGTFRGTTTFLRSGATKPVSLVIISPNSSSEEEFLNFFLPIRTVQVTLNYGDSFQILHPSVQWNQQTGRLLGDASVTVNLKNVTVSLRCDKAQVSGKDGLDCKTYTTTQGLIARTQVITASGQDSHPGEMEKTRPIVLQYQGTARLLDGRLIPATMTAKYPSRTREEEVIDLYFPPAEKLLTVTVKFFENGNAATFSNAKWDIRTLQLNGDTTTSTGSSGGAPIPGNQYNLTLSCTNYRFNGDQEPFECLYFSNQLSAPIEIQLQKTAATPAP